MDNIQTTIREIETTFQDIPIYGLFAIGCDIYIKLDYRDKNNARNLSYPHFSHIEQYQKCKIVKSIIANI